MYNEQVKTVELFKAEEEKNKLHTLVCAVLNELRTEHDANLDNVRNMLRDEELMSKATSVVKNAKYEIWDLQKNLKWSNKRKSLKKAKELCETAREAFFDRMVRIKAFIPEGYYNYEINTVSEAVDHIEALSKILRTANETYVEKETGKYKSLRLPDYYGQAFDIVASIINTMKLENKSYNQILKEVREQLKVR